MITMWTLTSALLMAATVTYAGRAGAMRGDSRRSENIARVGLSLILCAVTSGCVVRAVEHADFRWFHALLLVGAAVTLLGKALMLRHHTRHPKKETPRG